MVVDDDASVREMIRQVLEADGCQVCVAEDGVAGIRLAQTTDFDLLITDIIMPNKDGLETILEVRRSRPDIPILAISGGGRHAWTDVLETASLFGASQALLKPFSIQSLVNCVRELLNRPHTQDAEATP